MAYGDRIAEQLENVQLRGATNKILQFMQKIRNEYDEGQARRWPIELLQNGCDVAYPGESIRVWLELSPDKLTYRHTGQPFRVKDILSIIYQVSSKEPGQDTVGKFGTGFMSTYQLCEKVQVDSVLKDEGEEYSPFTVVLDRTGDTAEEILDKIQCSVEQVKRAEAMPEDKFCKDDYNTTFTYYLETERNKQAATIGMNDMKENILYVMLFSKKVQEITLVWSTAPENREVTYRRVGDCCICEEEGIHRLQLSVSDSKEGNQEHYLLYSTKNGITIAAGMDAEKRFVPLSKKTARLFVDFPLIGAEEFPFPVIADSRRLQPNEPRSGIALSDNPNSRDSVTNKAVLEEAVQMYGQWLSYVVKDGYEGLQHVIPIPEWKENKEHSELWVRSNLYRKLYDIIARLPILPTDTGMRSLSETGVYLVQGIGNEEGNGVRELLLMTKDYCVPTDEVDWAQVLSGYEGCIPPAKIIGLASLLQRAEEMLHYHVDEAKTGKIDWCQRLYELGMQNEEEALLIRSGQRKIYPNQKEEDWQNGRLFTASEIKADPGIVEIVKDVSEALDGLYSSVNEPLEIRKYLVHKDFELQGEVQGYELSRLYSYIRARSDRRFSVTSFHYYKNRYEGAWKHAWELLLSCGYDEALYRLYEQMKPQLGGEELREYRKEEALPEDIFFNAYYNLCDAILSKLETYHTLDGIQSTYFPEDRNGLYAWLNAVLGKAIHYLSEETALNHVVFPNQEGVLVKGRAEYWIEENDSLKRDRTETEELKEVLAVFADENRENNLYRVLLDRNVELKAVSLAAETDETVATKLNNVLQRMLQQKNISDVKVEYQDACTRVLAFIQEYPKKAEQYFPSFCSPEDQMRLLAPGAAVRMTRQAKQLEKLLEEAGASSMEEVLALLRQSGMGKAGQEDGFYGWYGDVFWDGEWDFGSREEFNEEMRRIGNAGEKYVFDTLCEGYSPWQEEERSESKAVYYNPETNTRATLLYPDTDSYKQRGWDICVELSGAVEEKRYIEVKTHTTKSVVRGMLSLTRSQMQMAAEDGDRYSVFLVSYYKPESRCVSVKEYRNPILQFAVGELRSVTEHYEFEVATLPC